MFRASPKGCLSVWSALLVIAILMVMVPFDYARGQTPPPTTGDWIIEDETVIEGETIVLRGNLYVMDGGSLTLRGCQLTMQCDYPGHRSIYIYEGGELWAFDTVFSEGVPNMNYNFVVRGRSHLEGCDISGVYSMGIYHLSNSVGAVVDSEVHHFGVAGYGVTARENATVSVLDSRVHDVNIGVLCEGSATVEVQRTNISNNLRYGCLAQESCHLRISECAISSNTGGGIRLSVNSTSEVLNNTIWDNDICIYMTGNATASIEGNEIHSTAYAIQCLYWTNVSIMDNHIHDVVDFAVTLESEARVIIDGNIIESVQNRGITLSQGSSATIVGNTLADIGSIGVNTEDRTMAYIEGNDISGCGDYGVSSWHSSSFTAVDNVISGCGAFGIVSMDSSTFVASRNTLRFNLVGIDLSEDSSGTVQGNLITNNTDHGVQASESAFVTVLENTISSNMRGIGAWESSRVVIRGNQIYANSDSGIGGGGTDVLLDIRDNHIFDNEAHGISIGEGSHAEIVGNIVEGNAERGVMVTGDPLVRVSNNTISQNFIGVHTKDDSEVTIEGNVIASNAVGVNIADGSAVHVADNVIASNQNYGLTLYDRSRSTLTGNLVSDNQLIGVYCALSQLGEMHAEGNVVRNSTFGVGFFELTNPNTRVLDSTILYSAKDGIFIGSGSTPLISGCTISSSARYGIHIRDVAKPTIYNCTITGSGEADIYSSNNSHSTIVGTVFDRARLLFNDTASDASVGWWVVTEVLDEAGDVVEGATVAIESVWGEVAFEGTTGPDGRTGYASVVEGVYSSTGEMLLTPHKFTASKGGLSGSVHRSVTSNLCVMVRLGEFDAEPGGLPTSGNLLLSFENVEEWSLVRGRFALELACSRFIDRIDLFVEVGGERASLGTASVSGGRATFQWNTTGLDNGAALLVARGRNSTYNVSVERSVRVLVDNEHSALFTTLASAGLATVASIGAAAAVGALSARGAAGIDDVVGELAEERLFELQQGRRALPGALQGALVMLSGVILACGYTYSLMSGEGELIALFVTSLVSVSVVVFAMESVEYLVAKRNRTRSHFSLWPAGLMALLLTTLLLRLPFGSPGKTRVESGADRRGAGLSGLAKLLTAPALLPIFVLLIWNGHYTVGVMGGYTAVMLLFVDSLPVRPLEGRRLYDWSRGAWAVVFALALFVLFTWQQVWVGYDVFLLIGIVTAISLALVSMARALGAGEVATVIVVGER